MDLLRTIGLSREYSTTLQYSDLEVFFNSRLNHPFKKGFINEEDIKLFFSYDRLFNPLKLEQPPMVQLKVKRSDTQVLGTPIQVSIISFWLILYAIFPLLGMVFFSFTAQQIPSPAREIILFAPLLFYPFFFGASVYLLKVQYDKLVKDIQGFELNLIRNS